VADGGGALRSAPVRCRGYQLRAPTVEPWREDGSVRRELGGRVRAAGALAVPAHGPQGRDRGEEAARGNGPHNRRPQRGALLEERHPRGQVGEQQSGLGSGDRAPLRRDARPRLQVQPRLRVAALPLPRQRQALPLQPRLAQQTLLRRRHHLPVALRAQVCHSPAPQ
jgi:hypothetical protein